MAAYKGVPPFRESPFAVALVDYRHRCVTLLSLSG